MSEPVDERLAAWADEADVFAEAVLEYHRDDTETLSPHELLTTLRRVDDVALHFDSGGREWVLTATVAPGGEARYQFYDLTGGGDPADYERKRAIALEELLRVELPEIVLVEDVPVDIRDREADQGGASA